MELVDLDWVEYIPEREDDETCGVVLEDGTIVALPNRSSFPFESFVISEQDIAEVDGVIIATWHTHPRGPNNLSIDDYNTFLDLPNLHHVILTTKSVSCYKAEGDYVMNINRRLL